MATASPERFKARLEKIINAWQTLAPTASFGGRTLAQFKLDVQASFDTRVTVKTLSDQLVEAEDDRNDADKVSNTAIQETVNGVKGDTTFGEDSALYEDMGYVRKSERKSGLTKKKKPKPPTP